MPYKNREKQLAYQRQHSKQYYQEHREDRREYLKNWRKLNPDKNAFYCKRWQENNKERRREYIRKWKQKHPNYFTEHRTKYVRKAELARRFKLIMSKGGKCERCGYDECFPALELHHINPEDKKGRARWRNKDFDLSKVMLLCSNCHKFIHSYKAIEFYRKLRNEVSVDLKDKTEPSLLKAA